MAKQRFSRVYCEHCVYCDYTNGEQEGICRKKAPQPVLAKYTIEDKRTFWVPVRIFIDWCGEGIRNENNKQT